MDNHFNIRSIGPVIKAAGLVPWTVVFVMLFFICSGVVAAWEPAVDGYDNALWLCFQVVTTIGLGDYTAMSAVGRFVIVVLSLYSVFFLALITGTVVSYCTERMNARRGESVAEFITQLENLPELSHEELVELSEKVKEFKARN